VIKHLTDTVNQIWEVDLASTQAENVFQQIYHRVKKASSAPNMPWSEKAIGRDEIKKIVEDGIGYPYPTRDQKHSLSLSEKLTGVDLGDKHRYALESRTKAIGLRFELNITSHDWESLKIDVHVRWMDYRERNPSLVGLPVWIALRNELSQLGTIWAEKYKEERMGSQFAEGVFFDMAGICTADFKRVNIHE
jgi:hypothetical protein